MSLRSRTAPLLSAALAIFMYCGGEAAAAEGAPFRQSLLQAPPPVVQIANASPAAAPQPDFSLFEPFEASPLAELVKITPVPFDDRQFAFELLRDDQRALALALDDWSRAVPRGERRRQRAAIASLYQAHDFSPLWLTGHDWSPAAVDAAKRLRQAADDGLDLRSLRIPAVEAGRPQLADDFFLSEAVAAYVAQASGSRVDPRRISRLIGERPPLPDVAASLARVAAAGAGAGEVLQGFNPPHEQYAQLRTKLAEIRAGTALNAEDQFAAANPLDPLEDFSAAARKAERRKSLSGKAPASRMEAEIIANMERWRWLPRDLGDTHVEVNIPGFELTVVRGGSVAHRTRVIVGKEETPTPVFSNALRYIIVNPSWNVPQSIINKELLPKHGGDLSSLAKRGWKVGWSNGRLSVRQPPGEGNALGRIKFMFPNDFSVYLHDTPSRGLFSSQKRAFSHGCMRVEDPFALAEAVLGPGSGWSEERVKKLIGGSERYINLKEPLPIHIEYFTAYVDEYGQLKMRDDLYGYSARVRKELGLGG
ncbi:L,D-transpeptidase family protein [Methylocystis heyeri]|uniref:L,D-transpeptidase family protein n=1 Tax=Methylocystis heyeri TaxID=391905 RepID=A0A6B8KIX0_9HYPH|nr:L,D-transpeptidase family protein [Methylocystis heyeri]QGM46845.1 L,D-transpeptidase family protein [Methylocystis heyeri]